MSEQYIADLMFYHATQTMLNSRVCHSMLLCTIKQYIYSSHQMYDACSWYTQNKMTTNELATTHFNNESFTLYVYMNVASFPSYYPCTYSVYLFILMLLSWWVWVTVSIKTPMHRVQYSCTLGGAFEARPHSCTIGFYSNSDYCQS